MRLTVRLLGLDLLDVELSTDEPSPAPDGGDITSYPMGFVARMDRPHEAETPDRDW